MPSARNIRDELLHITNTERHLLGRPLLVEVLLDRLYHRLLDRPEELGDLGADTWDVLERQKHHLVRTPAQLPAARYVRHNVELSWRADEAIWQWPPPVYTPYEVMVHKHLTGIRVLGDAWGMSKIAHPKQGGGILLSGDPTAVIAPRVTWKEIGKSVHCMLGATWGEVNDFLEGAGGGSHCLPNQPGFQGLTLAGSIGTGGHGSGLRTGNLASMATCIELGAIKPGDRAYPFARTHPSFDYVATHLGRLGPIVAIDLEVVPKFRIAEERTIHKLGEHGEWRADLEALVRKATSIQEEDNAHSAEIWIAPYADDDGIIVAALGVRRIVHEPLSRDEDRPAVLRCRALQALGHLAATIVATLEPSLIRYVLRRTVKATKTPRVVLSAREGLDFGAPNVNRMGAIEMGMDASNGPDASPIIRVIELLEKIAQTRDRYVFSPMGIRFVGQGPAHGLSPQAGRKRTMHIEVPTFADEEKFHGDDVLGPVQRLLASLGGRPHWGQRVYLTPDELRELWPIAEIEAMQKAVATFDADHVFANELLDPVLAAKP